MIVFKLFFKLAFKKALYLLIYITVYMGIMIMLLISKTPQLEIKEDYKYAIYLNNSETAITNDLEVDFREYLSYHFIFYELTYNQSKEEALFYQDIYAVITIDKDFSNSNSSRFLNVLVVSIADSLAEYKISSIINSYIRNAKENFIKAQSSVDKLALLMKEQRDSINSQIETAVLIEAKGEQENKLLYFFNYLSYALISGILTMVGIVMQLFKPEALKKRLNISAISNAKIVMELTLAILSFSLLFMGILVLIGAIIYPAIFSLMGLFYIINVITLTLFAAVLAYFLSLIVKSPALMSALSLLLALGPAFITGVFVSRTSLIGFVNKVAMIFPNWWFVSGNQAVSNMDFGFNYWINILVLVIYTLVIMSSALFMRLVRRKKGTSV